MAYFYIFLLISTYLLLFSTCRALHLLLPASGTTCLAPQKCVVLLQIATKVCCFTTVCHKSVAYTSSKMCQKNWHKQTMCPMCQIPGANLAHNIVVHKMVNI